MKRSFLFQFILIFAFAHQILAQVPERLNYQGIARSASGTPLANQIIGLRISIQEGNPGTVIYSESHSAKTNAFGLYVVNIGSGTAISGVFANINWSTGNKFTKVEIDPNGGISYTELGTSPLLSVPYALKANDANKVTLFGSGTLNSDKMVIQHSPAFPNWGLQYKDSTDTFKFLSSGSSIMDINLGTGGVKINGSLSLVDGTQGAGKVLTSDANGTASWTVPNFAVDKITIFNSGTFNPDKMVIQHSPAYPSWGLQYDDTSDVFKFIQGGTSVMDIGGVVGVNTRLSIKDGTQGTGKVLTSDVSGNASWQDFTTKVSAFQPPGCQKLASVTTVYQKIADMGSFTKSQAGTFVELNWQSSVYVEAFAGGATSAVYELRIDNVPTTIGNATAMFRSTEGGNYLPINITGIYSGLSAGSHTVSVWVKTTYGSATNAYFDPGCFNSVTNTVLVKEFK